MKIKGIILIKMVKSSIIKEEELFYNVIDWRGYDIINLLIITIIFTGHSNYLNGKGKSFFDKIDSVCINLDHISIINNFNIFIKKKDIISSKEYKFYFTIINNAK